MLLPNDILELIKEYETKYNQKLEKGFNIDEWNSFEEYKKYLEEELKK